MKYLSRKFLLTLLVVILSSVLPVVYKDKGVSDNVLLVVLALFGGIGAAYHFVNLKEAQVKPEDPK